MEIIFDDDELRQTAEVVQVINPFAPPNIDDLVRIMKDTAEEWLSSTTGYVSTYGFVLSGFKMAGEEVRVKSSVCAGTLALYLEKRKLR